MLRRRWGSGPELRWPGWTRTSLTPIVDGLVEQWLGAVETDLARRVETDPPGVIGPLTELTADYPFREGLWALLMTALYRVGRQADALAAFQHARSHLVEQLGVEPGPRLKDLESRILDHDERLRGGAPVGVTVCSSDGDGDVRLLRGRGRRPVMGDEPGRRRPRRWPAWTSWCGPR